jgi:hypothetical protein
VRPKTLVTLLALVLTATPFTNIPVALMVFAPLAPPVAAPQTLPMASDTVMPAVFAIIAIPSGEPLTEIELTPDVVRTSDPKLMLKESPALSIIVVLLLPFMLMQLTP